VELGQQTEAETNKFQFRLFSSPAAARIPETVCGRRSIISNQYGWVALRLASGRGNRLLLLPCWRLLVAARPPAPARQRHPPPRQRAAIPTHGASATRGAWHGHGHGHGHRHTGAASLSGRPRASSRCVRVLAGVVARVPAAGPAVEGGGVGTVDHGARGRPTRLTGHASGFLSIAAGGHAAGGGAGGRVGASLPGPAAPVGFVLGNKRRPRGGVGLGLPRGDPLAARRRGPSAGSGRGGPWPLRC